jgi:hypothetical protein
MTITKSDAGTSGADTKTDTNDTTGTTDDGEKKKRGHGPRSQPKLPIEIVPHQAWLLPPPLWSTICTR